MLPQVSLGASQLLKPASTPPRSYGRRHRSWHYETTSRRRKPTVETCVDNTAKLRPQASVLASRPCTYIHATHNERHRGKRPVHHDQVHEWRLGHRHGHQNQAPAMHNERRRGKRPGRNDELPATHNECGFCVIWVCISSSSSSSPPRTMA